MSEQAALDFDHDEMSLTDPDLVSLYLKYPDMQQSDDDFHDDLRDEVYADSSPAYPLSHSSPNSSPQSAQQYSSPLQNLTGYESPISSPLGPPDTIPFPDLIISANERELVELTTQFDQTLISSEVPDDTAELLVEMQSTILMLGSVLFSASGDVSIDADTVLRVSSAAKWLMMSLRQARKAIKAEIVAIESILELAPFTVRPAPEDLWTNYKQMAELIIEHTTIPSSRVFDLCDQLCHIYDACVYRPLLAISSVRRQDAGALKLLDLVYHDIMLLRTRYKNWMMAMNRIGEDFTKPTMRRILHSPEVMKDILEFEGHKVEALKSVLAMEAATRRVLTNFNGKHRRKELQFRKHECFVLHRGHASVS